jgi:alpha-tubulin suppressor-like RCC1 family protein
MKADNECARRDRRRRRSARWLALAAFVGLCLLVPRAATAASATIVATGMYHTCAVTTSGALLCWGRNDYGQVGDGTTTSRLAPVAVSGLGSGVTAVATGQIHTCAVVSGAVRCWGDNSYGQLGDGTYATRQTPVAVSGLESGVVAVAAGEYHSCALTSGGAVQCWGSNGVGSLGDGTLTDRPTPVAVSGLSSGVVSLATGTWHSCAVTGAGAVRCWGYNSYGQVGNGNTTNQTAPVTVSGFASGGATVSAGAAHTCALTTVGGVRCWGLNYYGQLGDGTTTQRLTPVAVSTLSAGGLAVSAGHTWSCAVSAGGAVQCWGHNVYGQLGDGTTTDRSTPGVVSGLSTGAVTVAGRTTHTCAVTSGGIVKCWGRGDDGQLGDGTATDRLTPVTAIGLGGLVPPTVSSISPARGAVVGGWPVTITGTNFVAGQSMITFGGSVATNVVVASATSLTATTPPHAAGVVDVVVTTPDGNATIAAGFTFDNVATGRALEFEGDLATDVSVYRPSTGQWFVLRSSTLFTTGMPVVTFGQEGDVPLMGDFDGDSKRDVAVYRPTTGTWFWLKSSTNNTDYSYKGWGVEAQGDVPVPGDFDGDGKTDPTVYRPAYGTWFVLRSSTAYSDYLAIGWGSATDIPMPGDYDGDGRSDVAVYRPSTGEWFVSTAASGFTTGPPTQVFGQVGDVPLRGDFDGDGKTDYAVYRPTTGTWFWLKSSVNNAEYGFVGWGVEAQGDVPVPGDYDGDGKTDPTVYRPAYGTWFVLRSSSGFTTYGAYGWGAATDVPLGGKR